MRQFYEFNQAEFFYLSPPAQSSMDDIGFAYVPSACVNGTNSAYAAHLKFRLKSFIRPITLPKGDAKYCNEYVCMFVCPLA